MCRFIDGELIIGNILIEMSKKNIETITFDQIINFELELSKQISKLNYYTTFNEQEIIQFKENYGFFITSTQNNFEIKPEILKGKNNSINRLNRYFRYGMPKSLTEEIEKISKKMFA